MFNAIKLIPELIEQPLNIKNIWYGYSLDDDNDIVIFRDNSIRIKKKFKGSIIQIHDINYSDINKVNFIKGDGIIDKILNRGSIELLSLHINIFIKSPNSDLLRIKIESEKILNNLIDRNLIEREKFSEELVIGGTYSEAISVGEKDLWIHQKKPAGIFATTKKIYIFHDRHFLTLKWKKGFLYTILLAPIGLSPFAFKLSNDTIDKKVDGSFNTVNLNKKNEIIKEIESYNLPTILKEQIEKITIILVSDQETIIRFSGTGDAFKSHSKGGAWNSVGLDGVIELKTSVMSYFTIIHPILYEFDPKTIQFK